jgi:hypothetical protein
MPLKTKLARQDTESVRALQKTLVKNLTNNLSNSVSIVSLNPTSVMNVSAGFTALAGIFYDGANIWVTDLMTNSLHKLKADGSSAASVRPPRISLGRLAFLSSPVRPATKVSM